MARQPIYSELSKLVAYELLYRSSVDAQTALMGDREAALAIVNSLIDIGLPTLAGEVRAYINVDRALLRSGSLSLLPAGKVVLEVVETVKATPENLAIVKGLHAAGFTIALDDFDMGPDTTPFLPYASILKLDVLALGDKTFCIAKKCKRPGLRLLAEKVQTRGQFEACRRHGFELYQGHFFSKPEVVEGRSIPAIKSIALETTARLQDPSLTLDQLENIVLSDLALTHRLLRMIRSASLGIPGQIHSIRQAIMFLGLRTVACVATLLAMSASSKKPAELMTTALVRGKTCELLASHFKLDQPERHFTVGLISVIDAMLDAPMKVLLAQLPLDAEINEALLDPHASGPLATVLQSALHFEKGRLAGRRL